MEITRDGTRSQRRGVLGLTPHSTAPLAPIQIEWASPTTSFLFSAVPAAHAVFWPPFPVVVVGLSEYRSTTLKGAAQMVCKSPYINRTESRKCVCKIPIYPLHKPSKAEHNTPHTKSVTQTRDTTRFSTPVGKGLFEITPLKCDQLFLLLVQFKAQPLSSQDNRFTVLLSIQTWFN